MPTLTHIENYTLPHDDARQRVSQLVADLRSEFGNAISDANEKWQGDDFLFEFRVAGNHITGKVHVESGKATLEIRYPFLFLPFKSKIEQAIKKRAANLFH